MRRTKLNKVLSHPDKEEITSRLLEGDGVREVAKWLASKYARSSKFLKISVPTLQDYRKGVLGIEGEVLKGIQTARKAKDMELEAGYINAAAKSTNAYKDKLEQIADRTLDVATRIIQMDAIVGDRIEHWFNLIKSGEALPESADYELRKFVDQQLQVLVQYRKLVEGMADKRIDYNVNVTVMNEQVHELQSAVVDLIREEMGPEKAIDFMEKLSNRLGSGQEVKALPGKVVDVTNDS